MSHPAPIFAPRRRRWPRWAIAGAVAVLVAWAAGLVWFAGTIPRDTSAATAAPTDAIVVLTGGSGRLTEGLALLAAAQARKLFVSGVYRGVDVAELLRVSRQAPEDLACCIVLGYAAGNTRGNARETARWMADEAYGSLRLVTANYHMPRSLLEFHRAMPGVAVVPHPVHPEHVKLDGWWHWPGTARLVVSEYVKYLGALVATQFAPAAAR